MKRALIVLALLLTACGAEDTNVEYLRIAGGGITFNYRYAQATIVLVARVMRPLPEGGSVEALFDIPGEATRESVRRPVIAGKLTYKLESKYLQGIKKGVPLKVTLRALDKTGVVLNSTETTFTSDVDQSTLPSKPLVDPAKPNYVPQLENLQGPPAP